MKGTKHNTMLTLAAVALCALGIGFGQQREDAAVTLQRAIHTEMVDGNLEAAIVTYQKFLEYKFRCHPRLVLQRPSH